MGHGERWGAGHAGESGSHQIVRGCEVTLRGVDDTVLEGKIQTCYWPSSRVGSVDLNAPLRASWGIVSSEEPTPIPPLPSTPFIVFPSTDPKEAYEVIPSQSQLLREITTVSTIPLKAEEPDVFGRGCADNSMISVALFETLTEALRELL